jgi:hypothetical protein
MMMAKRFKIGDHVTWNSEAGHVSGKMLGGVWVLLLICVALLGGCHGNMRELWK